MSYPAHDAGEVRALLREAGYDVPLLVLRNWSQREVHQAYSWVRWQKAPWKHGLRQPGPPWLLTRFDIRNPHQKRRETLWQENPGAQP